MTMRRHLLPFVVCAAVTSVAQAQVAPSTAKIEGRAVEQEFGSPPPDAPPPSPDPRDINGSYQQVEEKDDG
ncbi:hypothetical protein, partial [Phenylobacterium sp.]|uniref:hypothetical protein n=1 Tax=Phenylobacterium sp. TaxID=1871053 RepID=UPI002811FBEB